MKTRKYVRLSSVILSVGEVCRNLNHRSSSKVLYSHRSDRARSELLLWWMCRRCWQPCMNRAFSTSRDSMEFISQPDTYSPNKYGAPRILVTDNADTAPRDRRKTLPIASSRPSSQRSTGFMRIQDVALYMDQHNLARHGLLRQIGERRPKSPGPQVQCLYNGLMFVHVYIR
jgi:hypothetical protein